MKLTIRPDMTVDSRTIAEQCGIEHRTALQLLKTHGAKLESKFGRIAFEIAFETRNQSKVDFRIQNAESKRGGKRPGAGRKTRIAYLTEPQATAFITLFQNTAMVVDFKFALVAAFEDAKARLRKGALATPEQIKEYVLRDYLRRTAPVHDFGSPAKDGRLRIGYRGPTFTVSAHRLDDAAMVAADRLQLDDSQLMLFEGVPA